VEDVIAVETKTPAGNRTVTLDPTTAVVLAAHRRRQRRTFARHNVVFDEYGYVTTLLIDAVWGAVFGAIAHAAATSPRAAHYRAASTR
jgi:hypothetical protein